ncbi:hypothetical protein ETB97_008462 [Aspergillus alliaceus]|uniref:Major facilitator superfamily (MFS) profile domain-containing protein n=1 Tax=Petromyces alliaceus TaxID=209559 RepID=A0A8H5ZUZ1_PETAA|nr:hypothetical protein ETB97_008462 [Aspergillus burnettii]
MRDDIETATSVEGTKPNETLDSEETNSSQQDILLVTWNGPDDLEDPLNWSAFWKWSITMLTSFGRLVTLMSGSMLAPALEVISEDIHTSTETSNMVLSIFVLAFAFGPMLAPLTEVYGRRIVWIICSA